MLLFTRMNGYKGSSVSLYFYFWILYNTLGVCIWFLYTFSANDSNICINKLYLFQKKNLVVIVSIDNIKIVLMPKSKHVDL